MYILCNECHKWWIGKKGSQECVFCQSKAYDLVECLDRRQIHDGVDNIFNK